MSLGMAAAVAPRTALRVVASKKRAMQGRSSRGVGFTITIEGVDMQEPRLWYVNVFVSDLGRAMAFYGSTLGLRLRHADEQHGYASFDAGPVSLGLASVGGDSDEAAALVGRHTGVGLGVADLEKAYAQLLDAGVGFTMPPQKQPWGGFMATFTDPDGNVFYLDELREE
jgi:predicted enzyme related to lactoylglutathione lyase